MKSRIRVALSTVVLRHYRGAFVFRRLRHAVALRYTVDLRRGVALRQAMNLRNLRCAVDLMCSLALRGNLALQRRWRAAALRAMSLRFVLALRRSVPKSIQAYKDCVGEGFLLISSERQPWGENLKKCINHHHQLPMALGSGQSNVHQQFRRISAMLYHQAYSLEGTQKVLCRVKGGCFDMGTEFGLPDICRVTL